MQFPSMEQDHSIQSDPTAPSPVKATRKKKRIHKPLPPRRKGMSLADLARAAGTTKLRRATPITMNGRPYSSLVKAVSGESKYRGEPIVYREAYNAFHDGETIWNGHSIRATDDDFEAVRLELAGKKASPAPARMAAPEIPAVSVQLNGVLSLPGGFEALRVFREGGGEEVRVNLKELEALAAMARKAA